MKRPNVNHGAADAPDFERSEIAAPKVVNPKATFPCLIACDHATADIPYWLDVSGFDNGITGLHIACDLGISEVARQVAGELDCTAVLAGASRLVIDCNRWIDDPRSILSVSDGVRIPGNETMSASAQSTRENAVFWPYHDELGRQLRRIGECNWPPLFLSIHSFTPVASNTHRPWDAGTIWHESSQFSTALLNELNRTSDLELGDNQPFSGIGGTFTLDWHTWDTGIPACGLEIRDDHLREPEGRRQWVDRLVSAIAKIAIDERPSWRELPTDRAGGRLHPSQLLQQGGEQ